MKRFSIVFAALCVSTAALADGPLYGLRNPGDFGRQLITLDATTAALTPVSGSIDPPCATQQGQVALDSATGRFFFLGTPGVETTPRIYTLDVATGAVISNPTLSNAPLLTLEYDDDADTLYALLMTAGNGKQLVSIDAATGAVTTIGADNPSLGVTLGVHAIDSAGNRFFFTGTPAAETGQRLYTLDTQTGAVLSNPSISGGDVLALEYDDGENVLYGLRNPGDGGKQLISMDPATAAVTAISASIDAPLPNAAGVDALDADGNRFFFSGFPDPTQDFRLYSVDTQTGAVIADPPIAGTLTLSLFSIRYPKTPPPPPVVTVTIDVKSGINLKNKGVIPVVIFTTADFDASTVDVSTVQFGPGNATEVHGTGHLSDVDGDGDLDLVLHFSTQASAIPCGATSVSLSGSTTGGQDFEGSDTITTICP